MILAKAICPRDKVLNERPEKYPLLAARRYFHTRRPLTDLHTAYTEALAYYAALTKERS